MSEHPSVTITIEKPVADDFTAWGALYEGYAEFYKAPLTDEIKQTTWDWIFDESNPVNCRLAKLNGKPIGFIHFRAMPSPLRGKFIGFLDDLFVHPSHRGTDATRFLFAELESQAKENGWPSVRWITQDHNYRARNVYDKLSTRTMWITYQMDV